MSPIIVLCGVAAATAVVLSNTLISVSRYEISSGKLPENMGEIKLLHLSDLHKKKFGRNYEKLLRKIPKEKFDCVCFTGDFISRTETEISHKLELMKKLLEIAPVYYVPGNHELDAGKIGEKLFEKLEEIGVFVLRNSVAALEKNNEKIFIYGLESEKKYYVNQDGSYSHLPKINEQYLKNVLPEKQEGFSLLLAHSPFDFEYYSKWGADLVLSGHVHGGAVRIPFTKIGVLSPERKFFPKYSAGLCFLDNSVMEVSRGLGKLRLFNNSEISVVIIKRPQGTVQEK